jgi:hypothetical protein
MVRAALIASGLPNFLWGKALEYVVYVRNRSPTAALNGRTPFEALYGKRPNISNLYEFGCPCFVAKKESKITARVVEGRWLGFDAQSLGC